MSRVKTCEISEADLRKLFNALDQDNNGILDEEELKVLLSNLGMPESYANLCLILVGNSKSEVNFKQFQDFLAILLLYKNDKPKFLDNVFHCLDADDSGYLDIDEVFAFLHILGLNCSIKEALEILQIHDDNSDLKLNEKEFCNLIEGIEANID
ncbi:hypothetical protein M9Y10_036386 [Tritrichomonas musculus]|uniref:EF-hand domain-containing protein n=1 Tax=Tritrichomonas musculus TaxID=1915356 RepID=A0ABR2GV92_9EUKA